MISQTFVEIAPQQISSHQHALYVQALVPKGEQVMFGKPKNKVYKAQNTSKHSNKVGSKIVTAKSRKVTQTLRVPYSNIFLQPGRGQMGPWTPLT